MNARVVHTITVGDIEDPDMYYEQLLYEWRNTEEGNWIWDKAGLLTVTYKHINEYALAHIYEIGADITDENYLYWQLKFK